MLSIISPLYKKDYATVKTICNISNACKHLNIGCTSLIHFWIGTADSMVNMQQFMKARLILILPCSDRFSFLRISPKGAFIKVSGVRISCAVLIKNRIFSLNYIISSVLFYSLS